MVFVHGLSLPAATTPTPGLSLLDGLTRVILRLILLFTLLPFVETTLLLIIWDYTDSLWMPLLFVLTTGVAGALLARQQGSKVYRRIQQELNAGRMPTEAMIDGVMIFMAGILLVTPGVLTDLFGITVFIPPIRAFYRRKLVAWFHRTFKVQAVATDSVARPTGQGSVVDSYVVEKNSPDDVSDQI
jgi:UPF0716 protein FxsA